MDLIDFMNISMILINFINETKMNFLNLIDFTNILCVEFSKS